MNIIDKKIAQEIIEAGKKLHQAGLAPATAGNYSMRLSDAAVAITVSGKHKGELTEDDIIQVDYQGHAIDTDKKPSAETLLHTSLYQLYPDVNAVLHTHSICSTVLSRFFQDAGVLTLQDYELQKVFPDVDTHEGNVPVPIFENSQDIAKLAKIVSKSLHEFGTPPGYLIAGHGLYTWGNTMQDALRHVEGLEFLFGCELELLKLKM